MPPDTQAPVPVVAGPDAPPVPAASTHGSTPSASPGPSGAPAVTGGRSGVLSVPAASNTPGTSVVAARSEPIIRIEGVSRHFGRFTAVDDVTLDIHRGEVFGLIGHNGAGKSTLFRMMLGLLSPSSGTLSISGERVDSANARAVCRHIGYLPENVALWDNLSGLETLKFLARLKGIDVRGCQALLERVGLAHAGKRPVRAYSKGMRQRLGFAQALLGNPQVLFLDEPTTGLDPRAIHFFWDTLAELRNHGLTIVLTSHILAELQNRVDRVAVMTNGRIQALGTLAELRARFELPITLHVSLTPGTHHEVVLRWLHSLPDELTSASLKAHTQAGALILQVPRQHKMRLLQYLVAAREHIEDIQVQEPSLEEMFFANDEDGASDGAASPAAAGPATVITPAGSSSAPGTSASHPTQGDQP